MFLLREEAHGLTSSRSVPNLIKTCNTTVELLPTPGGKAKLRQEWSRVNTVGIYSRVPLCSSLSLPIYNIVMEEARWGAGSQAING